MKKLPYGQEPDYHSLDEMNRLLVLANAGFIVSRNDKNVGVMLQVFEGTDLENKKNLIGYLGFELVEIDNLDNLYETLGAYCMVNKVDQCHFEDDLNRIYFSLNKRCLFVLSKDVVIEIQSVLYFKDYSKVKLSLDGHTLELPEA